ncbi:uncharacterized protein LOC142620148 [Castanea sativa]|uniref:uncharacterized protein LOC142620148 n=1 Tax=Castanea sativa TaxID=21020 RepID=UPI003F64F404
MDILFSEENAKGVKQPHNNPLVIMHMIEGFNTRQILVNNSNSADIIYLLAFQQLKVDPKRLRPLESSLISFSGDQSINASIPASRSSHEGEPHPDDRGGREREDGSPRNDRVVDGEPTKTTKIGMNLNDQMKKELVQFLKENLEIFAWSHKDIPGIAAEVIQHRLNVNLGRKPVQQRRRVFALECNKAIMDEEDKLLAASFIRKVYYPN